METAVGMSTALVLAVDQQTGYGYGVRGMTAARGNGHRRADLLRLKSVIESSRRCGAQRVVSPRSRRCGAQRVASPDSTPQSVVWNVWRVPSGWGAGGRVAGDAHAARRRGHVSAHVRMCARAQVGSAAPLPAAAYAHASFTGRARRVRSARTNGVQMRGEVLLYMRAGACRALPGDLITCRSRERGSFIEWSTPEVRRQVLSRAVSQLADKRRGR